MPWQALLRELTLPVMTIEEIAKATGLRPNTLSDIRRGHVAEVNHRTRVELERFVRSLPSEEAS
jgi:transcriptional regulator with XRE-family HTH domain